MDIDLVAIGQEQVTLEILALFGLTKPKMPRAFHVLQGIDHSAKPNTLLVRLAKGLNTRMSRNTVTSGGRRMLHKS